MDELDRHATEEGVLGDLAGDPRTRRERERGPEALAACVDQVGGDLVEERVVAGHRSQAQFELSEILLRIGRVKGSGVFTKSATLGTGQETDSPAHALQPGGPRRQRPRPPRLARAGGCLIRFGPNQSAKGCAVVLRW